MHRPEQNVAYRVYWQGKDLLGTAQIEMPQIQHMTETLNGSGLAGEIESPTIGLTQSMTCKMTFTSATKDIFNTLDWTLQPLFECYSALQVVDESTGHPQLGPVPAEHHRAFQEHEPRHAGNRQEARQRS